MATSVPTLAGRRHQRARGRPTAVILAGGKGTRLAPLTTVLPKPLMPLGEEPILDVLLRQLRAEGWRQATLAVGHLSELIRSYCGSGKRYDLRLRYLHEGRPLGTVGPLANLPDSARDRTLLVMNGDVLSSLRYMDFFHAHRESGAVASIALCRRDVPIDFGVLDLDGRAGPQHRIRGFREKPEISATVSMGIYLFEPEVLEYIPQGAKFDLPDLVNSLLDDDRVVAGYMFDGYWLDIGRHTDYQQALDDFEELRPHLLYAAGGAPV